MSPSMFGGVPAYAAKNVCTFGRRLALSGGAAVEAASAVRNGSSVGKGVMPSGSDNTEGSCDCPAAVVGAAVACVAGCPLSAAANVKLQAKLLPTSAANGTSTQRGCARHLQRIDRRARIVNNSARAWRICAVQPARMDK